MKRGELWIGAGHAAYASKPRPMLIVQDDRLDVFNSTVVCPVTSKDREAKVLRLVLPAEERTGLERQSWVMVEKITALPKDKFSRRIGQISTEEMEFVSAAISDVLGLAR